MMRKIIFCCLLAVFTISCTNENESIDTNNNELVGRTFFAFPDEIIRFIGNDVYVYRCPTFPLAEGYSYRARGHWVGDTVHFVRKHWGYDSWYIDSKYYIHGAKWNIHETRRPMVELFEKPDYDKFEPRYTPANLSNQLWAMYEVKRPYKGSQYYDDIGEFFNDKSREDFNEWVTMFLYVTNDTLIVGEIDGIYRSPDRIEASGFLGGGIWNIDQGAVTYIMGDAYLPGWFQLNSDRAINHNFIGTIWSDKGEQQFIVGLKDQEKNRNARRKDSYYWIEPMTLDNVLPFLPQDL